MPLTPRDGDWPLKMKCNKNCDKEDGYAANILAQPMESKNLHLYCKLLCDHNTEITTRKQC